MKTQEETMRYRMSFRDVFYGGGVVNGARNITLMEDLCHRMMAKLYDNQGRCTCVEQVRLYDPIFAGDYIEYKARVLEQDGNFSNPLRFETTFVTDSLTILPPDSHLKCLRRVNRRRISPYLNISPYFNVNMNIKYEKYSKRIIPSPKC